MLNNAALTAAGNGISSVITHLSLHSGNPGTTGTNQTTAARRPVSWTNNNGTLKATNIEFTGGAGSGPVTHVGYWGAATSGVFYGYAALSGDTSFNAAGEYTVDEVTETASSS